MGLINYLRDTKGELRHISWPSKKQTIVYTVLVIVISIAVSLYLSLFDFVFVDIIKAFFI